MSAVRVIRRVETKRMKQCRRYWRNFGRRIRAWRTTQWAIKNRQQHGRVTSDNHCEEPDTQYSTMTGNTKLLQMNTGFTICVPHIPLYTITLVPPPVIFRLWAGIRRMTIVLFIVPTVGIKRFSSLNNLHKGNIDPHCTTPASTETVYSGHPNLSVVALTAYTIPSVFVQ